MDSGEVLGLGSLNFIGIFWDSVVDDWVVIGSWGAMVCWSWSIVT
jgi:hypothetical protein